jgi:hypothetical protein
MSQVQVHRSSRLKGMAAVAGCAAFAYAGTFMLSDRPLLGWAVILFFSVFAGVALVGVLAGGSELRIGRKGFEIAGPFKTTRLRWDEIEAPDIATIKRSRVVAIRYLPSIGKAGISRAITGMDVALGNTYGVPLEQLCARLNESRTRYLQAHEPSGGAAAQVPAASEPAAEASSAHAPKAARPILLAACAAFAVLVLNVLLRLVFKLKGMPITMGIACGVAGLVMVWFLKVARRAPTASERSRFLWSYALLVLLPYLGLFAMASASRGFNLAALLILALHAFVYPAAAQFFLAEKRFSALRIQQA